ncbi:ABC transporter ATP-binding protein [Paenibacillus sediminis]|uniref:ATP-binding cassette subfamily B protein n=1 Tax=Paenibacillus sediminis TaxID=664909 RepID=A0ABS4H4B4_9BACL|nr:ABC transporter ATP-binding protein [Paenibacillus sediminis]MBP1937378.1 ATP-binding cassette subfamily B protein [Paenibacillus sediminis]
MSIFSPYFKRRKDQEISFVTIEHSHTPWLRLRADVNAQLQFQDYEVLLYEDRLKVVDSKGIILLNILKEFIQDVTLRSSVGGVALYIRTDDHEQEIARCTIPYIDTYRAAMSSIEQWLQHPAERDNDGEELRAVHGGTCSKCGATLRPGQSSCLKCKSKMFQLTRVLRYCRPYQNQMLVMLGILIVSVFVDLAPPYMTSLIIDEVSSSQGKAEILLWMIVTLALIQVASTGMQILRGFLGIRIGSKLIGDIRKDMFHSLMELSMRFFDKRQVSQFIGRINHDTNDLRDFLSEGMIQFVTQSLTAVFILAMLLHLNWQLTLMILLPTPLLIMGMMWFWPKVRTLWYAQWQSSISIQNRIGEALQGIRVIKAFAQEWNEKLHFDKANDQLVQRNISIQNMWLSITPLFSLFTALCGVFIWYAGGRYVLSNQMTIGTLSAYIAYLSMFFGPMKWFVQSMSWVNRALGASERIMEVIEAPIDVADGPNAVHLPSIKGEIRFQNVHYGYEKDRQVLHDIDLTIRPGEMIGLVGHSGAGKSTMVNLMLRFYDPDSGNIFIDGHHLKDIKQEDLRKHIGVVLQETFLFDGTIAQNIAFGCPDAEPEQIIHAARIANAHDFICRLPDGYDTKVGERGHRLSGGEKQRIAIARAVLLNPPILILDEATASVDTETERQIQEAIQRLIQGRTTIAIAHRLSTLKNADRIVVMEKGRVVEMGTHQQLYERRDHYYRLVESQKQNRDTTMEVG